MSVRFPPLRPSSSGIRSAAQPPPVQSSTPRGTRTRKANPSAVLPLTPERALLIARQTLAEDSHLSTSAHSATVHAWSDADPLALFFNEHDTSRQRLAAREQSERAVVNVLQSQQFAHKVLEPKRAHLVISEAHDRAQIHRAAALDYKLLQSQFRVEHQRTLKMQPRVPVPPPRAPAASQARPRSDSWLARHAPVDPTAAVTAVLDDEAAQRSSIEAEFDALCEGLASAEASTRAQVRHQMERRNHNARLALWRDERDARQRREQLMSSLVMKLQTLEVEEERSRDVIASAESDHLNAVRRESIQNWHGVQQQLLYRSFVESRRTLIVEDFINVRIPMIEALERRVRDFLWSEERMRNDVDCHFRDRQSELQQLYLTSLTHRDAIVRIQQFIRRVRRGMAGWRRSHRVVGDMIRAKRQQVALATIREQARSDICRAHTELAGAIQELNTAYRQSQLQLLQEETRSRNDILMEERWWLLSQLESARSEVTIITHPLLRKVSSTESMDRQVILDVESQQWDEAVNEFSHERRHIEAVTALIEHEGRQRQTILSDEEAEYQSSVLSTFGPEWAQLLQRLQKDHVSKTERMLEQLVASESERRRAVMRAETASWHEEFAPNRVHGPMIEMQHWRSLEQTQLFQQFQVETSNTVQQSLQTIHATALNEMFSQFVTLGKQAWFTLLVSRESEGRALVEQREERLRNGLCGHVFVTETEKLRAVLQRRNEAALVLQTLCRRWADGDLGHSGLCQYLRKKYSFKRERAECLADVDKCREIAREAKRDLSDAISEHNTAVMEEHRRLFLQLSRDESTVRKKIAREEDFVWFISRRNLSDCILDIIDRFIAEAKDSEWSRRRNIAKQEANEWDVFPKLFRESVLDAAIRPAQRCVRCFLARKRRRERLSFLLETLPEAEERQRERIVFESVTASVGLHRSLIAVAEGLEVWTKACCVELHDFCLQGVASLDQQWFELLVDVSLREETANRNDIERQEQREFDVLSLTALKTSRERVEVELLERSEREMVAAEECSARLRKFVEAPELVMRQQLVSDVFDRALPLLLVEVQEMQHRTIIATEGEYAERTSLLASLESVQRAYISEVEERHRVAIRFESEEDSGRCQLYAELNEPMRRFVMDTEFLAREYVHSLEKGSRDRIRVLEMEGDARFDLVRERRQFLAAAAEELEAVVRDSVIPEAAMQLFIATAWCVQNSFHEKVDMFADHVASDSVRDLVNAEEDAWRLHIEQERVSVLVDLVPVFNQATIQALCSWENRARVDLLDDETVWRERLSTALEHRVAHAAALTIQGCWEDHRQRKNGGTRWSRAGRQQRRHLVHDAEHDHTKYGNVALHETAVAMVVDGEASMRNAIEAEAARIHDGLVSQSEGELRQIDNERSERETTARSALCAEECSMRDSVAAAELAEWTHIAVNFGESTSHHMQQAALYDHAVVLAAHCIAVEGDLRRCLEGIESAERGVLLANSTVSQLKRLLLAAQEERARLDVERDYEVFAGDVAAFFESQRSSVDDLLNSEDTARIEIDAGEAEQFSIMIGDFWLVFEQQHIAERNRACVRIQRWWHSRSLLSSEGGAMAEALFLRDTLAAEHSAAIELRDFAEAVNNSAVCIQALFRGWRARHPRMTTQQAEPDVPPLPTDAPPDDHPASARPTPSASEASDSTPSALRTLLGSRESVTVELAPCDAPDLRLDAEGTFVERSGERSQWFELLATDDGQMQIRQYDDPTAYLTVFEDRSVNFVTLEPDQADAFDPVLGAADDGMEDAEAVIDASDWLAYPSSVHLCYDGSSRMVLEARLDREPSTLRTLKYSKRTNFCNFILCLAEDTSMNI